MGTAEDQPLREPIITIRGQKVGLGPLRREDIPRFVEWLNDFEVTRGLDLLTRTGRITIEGEEEWYEGYLKDQSNAIFGIYELESGQIVGSCGLHEIDFFQRTASFGILIGPKEHWNKGFGTEATRLLVDYGFTVLGLHNIMLWVYAYNQWGIRAYEKVGFKVMGRRRESRRFAGKAYDAVYMDILATEFESPFLKNLLAPEANPQA